MSIGVEDPAKFQDAVRKKYPIYQAQNTSIPKDVPPQVADVMRKLSGESGGNRAYSFISGDSSWKLGLGVNSLSLSTTAYKRWEEFSEELSLHLNILNDIYEPSFYQRVGLRYRDVIIRSALGVENEPWSELLQPYIAAELASPSVADSVIDSTSKFTISLGKDVGHLRVNHFLANVVESNEQCYVIDVDLYLDGKVEIYDALSRLSTLNKYAGRFFRWCVTKKLYQAMDPKSI